jgi:tetrahydromethanopterin S-methyltransferase subunit C
MELQTMTDNSGMRKGRSLGWTIAIAGGAGLYFGLTSHQNPEPLIKTMVALLMVLAGMLLLFPLAAFGPRNEVEREFRFRTSATGAGNIVFGVAQLIPNRAISLTLGVISLLFMLVAFRVMRRRFLPSPDALSK